MKKYLISDHTERYTEAGLSFEFLAEITKAVNALQAAGYEPYDQPYGYAMHGNDQHPGNRHKDGYQRYQDIPEALQGT